jgi:hypothetical protein
MQRGGAQADADATIVLVGDDEHARQALQKMAAAHALLGIDEAGDAQAAPLFGSERRDPRRNASLLQRALASTGLPTDAAPPPGPPSRWGRAALEAMAAHAGRGWFGIGRAPLNHLACTAHADPFGISREPLLGDANLMRNAVHGNVEDAAAESRRITRVLFPRLAASIALEACGHSEIARLLRHALDQAAPAEPLGIAQLLGRALRRAGYERADALGQALQAHVDELCKQRLLQALGADGCSARHPAAVLAHGDATQACAATAQALQREMERLQDFDLGLEPEAELRGFLAQFAGAAREITARLRPVHLMNLDYALGLAELQAAGGATDPDVDELMREAISAERESTSDFVLQRARARGDSRAAGRSAELQAFERAQAALQAMAAGAPGCIDRIAACLNSSDAQAQALANRIRANLGGAADSVLGALKQAAGFVDEHSNTATLIYLMGVSCTMATLAPGSDIADALNAQAAAGSALWARAAASVEGLLARAGGDSELLQALAYVTGNTTDYADARGRRALSRLVCGGDPVVGVLGAASGDPPSAEALREKVCEFLHAPVKPFSDLASAGAKITSAMATLCYVVSGLRVLSQASESVKDLDQARAAEALLAVPAADTLQSSRVLQRALEAVIGAALGKHDLRAVRQQLDQCIGQAAEELRASLQKTDAARDGRILRWRDALTAAVAVRIGVNALFEWNDALPASVEARLTMAQVPIPLLLTSILESHAKHFQGAEAHALEAQRAAMQAVFAGKPVDPRMLSASVRGLVERVREAAAGSPELAALIEPLQALQARCEEDGPSLQDRLTRLAGRACNLMAYASSVGYVAYVLAQLWGLHPSGQLALDRNATAAAGLAGQDVDCSAGNIGRLGLDPQMPAFDCHLHHTRDAFLDTALLRSVFVAGAVKSAAAIGSFLGGVASRREAGQAHAVRSRELGQMASELSRHLGAGLVANFLSEGTTYAERASGTVVDTLMSVGPDLMVAPLFRAPGWEQSTGMLKLLASYQHDVLSALGTQDMGPRDIVNALRSVGEQVGRLDFDTLRLCRQVLHDPQALRDGLEGLLRQDDFVQSLSTLHRLYAELERGSGPARRALLDEIATAQRDHQAIVRRTLAGCDRFYHALHGREAVPPPSPQAQDRLQALRAELNAELHERPHQPLHHALRSMSADRDVELVRQHCAHTLRHEFSPQAIARRLLQASQTPCRAALAAP